MMDDLINRQAAIDDLHGKDPSQVWDTADVEVWINALPTAQPKTGKWLYKRGMGWGETWICSECGEKTTSTVMGKPRYKFCPMCGAKMEEEDGTVD